jgi:hypothetical protein
MPPRRATREAGPATLTPIDELTTAADIAEALGHLVTAARTAADRHNTIVYDLTHKRIDDHLETWQVLSALESSR